jgi:hypothetical protein
LRNKSSGLAVYFADSTCGITITSEDPTAMFTTFHDQAHSSILTVLREPLVAIWAVIAIAGIAFISLGVAHPSSSEAAVARAMIEARQSHQSGN